MKFEDVPETVTLRGLVGRTTGEFRVSEGARERNAEEWWDLYTNKRFASIGSAYVYTWGRHQWCVVWTNPFRSEIYPSEEVAIAAAVMMEVGDV